MGIKINCREGIIDPGEVDRRSYALVGIPRYQKLELPTIDTPKYWESRNVVPWRGHILVGSNTDPFIKCTCQTRRTMTSQLHPQHLNTCLLLPGFVICFMPLFVTHPGVLHNTFIVKSYPSVNQ